MRERECQSSWSYIIAGLGGDVVCCIVYYLTISFGKSLTLFKKAIHESQLVQRRLRPSQLPNHSYDFFAKRLNDFRMLAKVLECLTCSFGGGVNRRHSQPKLGGAKIINGELLSLFLCHFDEPSNRISFLRGLLALLEELNMMSIVSLCIHIIKFLPIDGLNRTTYRSSRSFSCSHLSIDQCSSITMIPPQLPTRLHEPMLNRSQQGR